MENYLNVSKTFSGPKIIPRTARTKNCCKTFKNGVSKADLAKGLINDRHCRKREIQ